MQRIKGMIDVPIEELLFSALAWVCFAAWRALPLLCLVLVFDLLFKRRIAARFHCLLWMIVAARMLCPFSVESSFSLHGNLLTTLEAVGFSNSQAHAPLPYDAENLEIDYDVYTMRNEQGDDIIGKQHNLLPMRDEAGDEVVVSQIDLPDDVSREDLIANTEVFSSPAAYEASIIDEHAEVNSEVLILVAVAGTWLLVMCLFLVRGLIQSLRFASQLRRCAAITDQLVVDQVLRACDTVGVGRRPVLKEVDGLTVPAVLGIRRPTICLPVGTIDELCSQDLRLVLLHELAHVRRRDGLVLSLCLIVRALHWFNPLAWLVVSRIRNYMEQAASPWPRLNLPRTLTTEDFCFGMQPTIRSRNIWQRSVCCSRLRGESWLAGSTCSKAARREITGWPKRLRWRQSEVLRSPA
ncbi:MAG: beta-lactamase regulating signal transducer with metallopeptidase domain [Planctomycetaceae bacterium]|jgi:beta-lactamase regulating signal transducer with metallopeptidase domain